MVWLIAVLLALMATPDVGARTCYVAVEGDDNGPGTQEQPMRSVGAALRAVARDGGEIHTWPASAST